MVDYRDPELADRIRDAAPDGLDVYWDTSGHHDLDMAVDLLGHRGRIVLMAGRTARPELPVGPLYTRDAALVGFAISSAHVGELADAAAMINRRLAGKALPARIARILPLAEAANAHRMVEQGQVHGRRVVLRP